jgi:small subunit ribosomal protein S9
MADETPNDEREGAETPAEAPEQPPAEQPTAEEPAPAEQPAAEEPAPAVEQPAPAAEEPAPAADAAPAPAAEQPAAQEGEDEDEEVEEAPRVKPEIPGADLELDLVAEGEDPLARQEAEEAEAQAAAEEADALADQPIAAVTIDLASGARYRATGKRKTAVARVTLKPGTGAYVINGRELDVFFPRGTLQRNIRQPLETVGYETRMDVVARLHGGGVSAQAGALRHGISRALLEADPNLRGELKRRGFLTRDARAKERKKAGLKKARKRPQFSKR